MISYAIFFHEAFALEPVVQITSAKSGNSDIPNDGTVKILLGQANAKVSFSFRGFDDDDHILQLQCSFDGIVYLQSNCSSVSQESQTTFTGPDGVERAYYVKTGMILRDLPASANTYTVGVRVINDNYQLSPAAIWKFNVQTFVNPDIHIIEPSSYKVKVKFDSITVHNNHDPFTSGDGEYWLWAIVQGQTVDLNEASSGKLWDVGDGQKVTFAPYASATVTIPEKLPLSIFTVGFEEDHCAPMAFGKGTYAPTVIKILNGPKSEWLSEIRKIIDGSNKYFLYDSCGVNPADRIGFVNKIYEPAEYGAGAHTRVLSTNGDYPNDPSMPADFTLRYTISVENIPQN